MNMQSENEVSCGATSRPRRPPDLGRPLFCLFGLVFDDVDMDGALAALRGAVRDRRPCTIATPNVNFLVRAARDPAFRGSVLRSDLSLVDGMPLVWAGRLIGASRNGRVAGADLFERLRRDRSSAPPLKVYLFGGPPGVARLAAGRLNAGLGGVRCVGHHAPGFGSVAGMSGPEVIRDINRSGADFVLVALGAGKGQAWIERNRAALAPPVVSHLGAAINHAAGTVRRAPRWMRGAGLEWLWRIGQEPDLWRRYAGDALGALALVAPALASAALAAATRPRTVRPPVVAVSEGDDEVAILLEGALTAGRLVALRAALDRHGATPKRLRIDLRSCTALDSRATALLLVVRRFRADEGLAWRLSGLSFSLARRLAAFGAADLASPG